MKEELVTFGTAKLAKEKGFIIPCYNAYRVWREEIRKSETEKQALEFIGVEYEPDYKGGSYAEVKEYYQSKEHTLAPTQSLLQKWLREEHNIECYAYPFKDHAADVNDPTVYRGHRCRSREFKKFEDALEQDLQNGLKLIKNE